MHAEIDNLVLGLKLKSGGKNAGKEKMPMDVDFSDTVYEDITESMSMLDYIFVYSYM